MLDSLLARAQQVAREDRPHAAKDAVILPAGDERIAMLKGAGAGALGAGAIALLFGSKGTRKFAKKAAKVGGTAALGGLAYKVYADWQAQQASDNRSPASGQTASASSPPTSLDLDQFDIGTPIGSLAERQAAQRGETLIQAMISAARADGHVDDDEMELITRQIEQLDLEQDVSHFLLAEMRKPVDVARIAALADTRESATELYLASLMVADVHDPPARAYLNKLAEALQLEGGVVAELEARLGV